MGCKSHITIIMFYILLLVFTFCRLMGIPGQRALRPEWLGGLSVPLLSLPGLSFAWTYSPDSLILLHPAIDFMAVSLSPSLTYALTPGYCVPLGGLPVLVGSSTYPSLGRMLGPSSIGLWLCWRLGCRPVPSSHFLDSVSYLACSLDSCSYGFLR